MAEGEVRPGREAGAARPPGDTLAGIVAALDPIAGRRVLDVGCGHGRLASALLRRDARVAAIDPDPAAVAATRIAAPGAEVVQASAERLPFADGVFEGAVLLNSLHHVPRAGMEAALREVARVLRARAPLVVVEPLAEGSCFEAMRPLEDETAARAAAQAALAAACAAGLFTLVRILEYERLEAFSSVDGFLERLVAAEPARQAAAPEARNEVAARFAALATPHEGRFLLRQPMRLHHLLAAGN